jgi:hypothetical protein
MALETASFIGQLVPANPTGTDPKSLGDNHLRLIKAAVQGSFPNLGNEAVVATAAQINIAAQSSGQYSTGTSTTSLLIGTGTKTFTTQANRAFGVGQRIKITSQANIANYMLGTCSAYDSTTGAMSVLVDAIGGSGTFADWSIIVLLDARTLIARSARTSNTMLAALDNGSWVDVTSGTFTQTFDAVATLGDKWWIILGNSGTGDVTLDPSGSETIDGLTSYIMYPGEVRFVQCDGTTLRTIVWHAGYKVFTASDVWTKPPGYTAFSGELIAAGASGDRKAAGTNRAGGGGGALAPFRFLSSQMSATEVLVLGAPGAAVTVDATGGNVGSNATFKGLTSQGGRVGGGGANGAVGGAAFNRTNGAVTQGADQTANIWAYYGGGGSTLSAGLAGSVYGASGGDSIDTTNTRVAATQSIFGAAGGTCNSAGTVITPGTGAGAGGAASTNGTNSGAGIRGELRIWGEI